MFLFSNSLALEGETICVSADNQGVLILLCFNTTTGAGINSLSSFSGVGQLAFNASGMAIVNSTVYISFPNLILTATPLSKRSEWDQSNITFNGLNGLCKVNSTHLLLITSTSAQLYDVYDQKTTSFVDGLQGALVCTVNSDNGDVYISNGIQIHKYDYTGNYLITIGEEGGR